MSHMRATHGTRYKTSFERHSELQLKDGGRETALYAEGVCHVLQYCLLTALHCMTCMTVCGGGVLRVAVHFQHRRHSKTFF